MVIALKPLIIDETNKAIKYRQRLENFGMTFRGPMAFVETEN